MDTITLIYILISLTFGAAVTFFILKNKKTNTINNPEIDTQSLDNKELIGGYKQEIQEFKMQILNLEKQLKHALDNNTDELIQNQLIESENLKSKIKDTENKFAIENNRFISENTILQDKISKYEEKIIDLQEGIVTEKNETASKTSEIEELLDKIRILEKSNQELDSEKNQIATELKDKTVENKLQVDSLISENTKLQDQISNYDKKVKNLEEDIEDYEDDILSEKKKTATKIAENEELLDKIRNLEKSNQELNSEKNHIEAELRDKKEENKLQAESLSFIQEILTAEDLKTEEIADHRPIDNIVEYVKELKDLLSIDHQMLERWSIIEKKQWIRNKTTIAFVGEFSAGKTSIVNRILSQDNPNIPLLPVNTKATTAIPTYISRGQSTLYRFVSPDHVLKGISEITFNQISKEVLDQVKGASNLLSHFVMSYKNDNLEELSILDTPGFNSNDKKDAERTIEVINECDALFWVMDVNAGTINKSSIDLIR